MNGATSLLVAEGRDELLKRLARACKRCGVTLEQQEGQTTLTRLEWPEVRVDENGYPMPDSYRQPRVVASAFDRWTLGGFPGVSGFEFVCRLEHTEAGNILSGEAVEGWRDAKPTCAHCCKARRRKDTFVLRNTETGELVRVGRNCLGDFLRTDPTVLVRFADLCRLVSEEDEDGGAGFGGGRWLPETAHFLACALACIEATGFRKASESGSTRSAVAFLTDRCPKSGKERTAWLEGQPKDAHKEKASMVLEWLRTACAHTSSDYLANLHVVSQLDFVSERHAGLLASAPVAWAKAMEIELHKRQALAALPESRWLGEEKERVTFTGVLLRTRDVESPYGTKTLFAFRSDDGSDAIWWCSGHRPRRGDCWGAMLEPGDRVTVKGTVGDRDTYQGRKQTQLKRCVVTYIPASTEQAA